MRLELFCEPILDDHEHDVCDEARAENVQRAVIARGEEDRLGEYSQFKEEKRRLLDRENAVSKRYKQANDSKDCKDRTDANFGDRIKQSSLE